MLKSIFSGIILLSSIGAFAQSVAIGAHVGAVGADSSEIGYGVNLTADPYGVAAFRIDATFAPFAAGNYFSTSPAVIVYPFNFEEMKLGFLGGAGFYSIPADKTHFGLNYGVIGDFSLSENFSVGMEARGHSIFDVEDMWSVFLTAAFRFDIANGGW
jgi:hypothetical protein